MRQGVQPDNTITYSGIDYSEGALDDMVNAESFPSEIKDIIKNGERRVDSTTGRVISSSVDHNIIVITENDIVIEVIKK